MLDSKQRKRLKAEAHHLKPVIRIGQGGLSDGVVQETDRTLDHHPLIKVHIHNGDRAERARLAQSLADAVAADLVHSIGKVTILYREQSE
ncbi:MAG: ribosome assembly RNA-binding protein YhbY [Mariprofundales bacterium]|nr:ribosome assembly RNA-binding protein YhbY [Mariprofundales bacterium]